ncbi:MAG TPA: hypothetical protein VFI00_04870, partial [Kribbella sp.]|nr:hypothetical protein [Kribbella sp.]
AEDRPTRTRPVELHVLGFAGHPMLISALLVKVAVGIANVTGLYYSIALLTDSTCSWTTSAPNCALFTARAEYWSPAVRGPKTIR